jgi:hypothetical protein
MLNYSNYFFTLTGDLVTKLKWPVDVERKRKYLVVGV